MDALVVASASPCCFRSWCDERLFPSVFPSIESRGDRVAADGEPGTCFCNWPNCVCTCEACLCNSAAAATASLCFFNSNWWCRSWARISRSNRRASRASRSFYCMRKIIHIQKKSQIIQHDFIESANSWLYTFKCWASSSACLSSRSLRCRSRCFSSSVCAEFLPIAKFNRIKNRLDKISFVFFFVHSRLFPVHRCG